MFSHRVDSEGEGEDEGRRYDAERWMGGDRSYVYAVSMSTCPLGQPSYLPIACADLEAFNINEDLSFLLYRSPHSFAGGQGFINVYQLFLARIGHLIKSHRTGGSKV